MSSQEEQVQKLQSHVQEGVEATESALSEITGKLQGHDSEKKPEQPAASSYLNSAIEAAKSAVQELKKSAEDLSHTSVGQSTINIVTTALAKVQTTLKTLSEEASAYDEKYFNVSGTLSTTKDGIENIVTSAKVRTHDVINDAVAYANTMQDNVRSTAIEAGDSAYAVAGGVVKTLEGYDQTYKVSERVTNAATSAATKAKELDEYYGVSKKAAEIDERVTGGIGSKAVTKGTELLQTGSEFVTGQITAAKEKAESTTATAPSSNTE